MTSLRFAYRVVSVLVFAAVLSERGRAGSAEGATAIAITITDDLSVSPLRDGVWLHTSWHVMSNGVRYPANGLLVADGNALVLIDTAWGEQPTADLLDWVDRELGLPVVRAIATHGHEDRIGGARVLEERGIPYWVHPLTAEYARTLPGSPRAPEIIADLVQPGDAAVIGGIEVFYPGPAHTRDNIVVWLPGARILFGGCAVKSADSRDLGNVADADIPAWPASMSRVESRYADASTLVVPGHGAAGRLQLLVHTRELADQAAQR